jgi:hypothetical protein
MKVITKPNVAEAWQVTHDQGWWCTFLWLSQHNIDAEMKVATQRPEEERFIIHTPEGPVTAYSDDWIVIMGDDVGVYNPIAFERAFEVVPEGCQHTWCDWIKDEERYSCEVS